MYKRILAGNKRLQNYLYEIAEKIKVEPVSSLETRPPEAQKQHRGGAVLRKMINISAHLALLFTLLR